MYLVSEKYLIVPQEFGMDTFTVAELENKLKTLQQDYDAFAYIVSHDLNAPLRGIQMIASWLQQDYEQQLDKEGSEMLQLLTTQVQRLQRMLDALLEFSRIGRIVAPSTKVNTRDVINAIITNSDHGQNIDWDIDRSMPIVIGDAKRIEQLFTYLMENATQAIEKSGNVQIRCEQHDNNWHFQVLDNGAGIPEILHVQVFNFFYTTDTDKENGKLGCGLSYAKKIVETHNGNIWLTSEVGQGTAIHFTLPVSQEDELNGSKQ